MTCIEHHIRSLPSLFWPQFHGRSQFLATAKIVISCDFFIIIIIMMNFFRWVFSECHEAIATSLILLETILPGKCAFIIGFSCTVWTKMRSLADSLADGVLADAILIPPYPPIPPTYIRKVRGLRKKYGN